MLLINEINILDFFLLKIGLIKDLNIKKLVNAGGGIRTRGLTVSQEKVRALLKYPMSRAL